MPPFLAPDPLQIASTRSSVGARENAAGSISNNTFVPRSRGLTTQHGKFFRHLRHVGAVVAEVADLDVAGAELFRRVEQ